MPDQLRIVATVAGWQPVEAAADDERPRLRRFAMTAYTGQAMRLAGWEHPVVVDLAGLHVTDRARPILKDHNPSLIVGHTERIANEDGRLEVAGVVSGAGRVAAEVVTAADNGFPWRASLMAGVSRAVFVPEGQTAQANGRDFAGPVFIARAATLGEVSFVALGADDDTAASIAAAASRTANTLEILTMDFEQWIAAQGFTLADLSDDQTANLRQVHARLHAAPPAPEPGSGGNEGDEPVPVGGASDPVQAIRAQVAAEEERIAAIREVCADRHPTIRAQAIREGWDRTRAELEVLRAERPNGVRTGGSAHQPADARVLEAALCLAGGLDQVEQVYEARTLEAADQRFRHHIGLQELLLEAAWSAGYGGRNFRSDMRGVLRAAFSTFDLPGILSNVANKFLLAGFEGVESTWRSIAAVRSVRDFKRVTSYRLTGDFVYEEVGPDGELKHAGVGEEEFGNQARTYGRMFSITRNDLINDDLGALTAVPRRIGRGGALKLNQVFWKAFLDNGGFFSAGNKNLLTGAASTLSLDALTEAERIFLDQVDPDGHPLAVTPAVLLVPNALFVLANNLMRSTEVRPGGDSSRRVETTVNPHAGKFQVQRSSYLSNAQLAGHSTSAWYLLAAPAEMPVIEVAFLDGQQAPTVESADSDFNTLGIQMRGYHDFGVEKQDHRGGVKAEAA